MTYFIYLCFRKTKSHYILFASHSIVEFSSNRPTCVVMHSWFQDEKESDLKFNAVELIRNSPRMKRFTDLGTRTLFKFNLLHDLFIGKFTRAYRKHKLQAKCQYFYSQTISHWTALFKDSRGIWYESVMQKLETYENAPKSVHMIALWHLLLYLKKWKLIQKFDHLLQKTVYVWCSRFILISVVITVCPSQSFLPESSFVFILLSIFSCVLTSGCRKM